MKFYRCNHCGNLFAVLNDGGVVPVCCGEAMMELEAGVTDGSAEKHVPVIERNGNKLTVKVGSDPHPMTPEHYIQWIAIEQNSKFQVKKLTADDEPTAEFIVDGDVPITAYEYCNLHGLWRSAEE